MKTSTRMIGLWLVVTLAVALAPSGYAQREPALAPRLAELLKAAQAEGELSLVGGGATWGAAEGAKMIQDALNKKYGLNVRIRYAPGPSMPVLAVRLTELFKAGVKADTDLYVGSSEHMKSVMEAGWARPFPWREVFPHIPADTIEHKGQIIRAVDVWRGITYNTREIKRDDVPRRLEDVLHPKWKGKIASTPYAASLYNLASDGVWGYDRAMAFSRALSRQIGGLIRCGEESRIASGEFLMLVMNCGNYGGENFAKKTGAPVGVVVLEDAPMLDSFYYVVPKNSAAPNLATLLVGFLMSKEGQDLLYESVGWTSRSVEGTPVNRLFKELAAKGVKVVEFTADQFIKEPLLGKAQTEIQKILAGR